MIKMILDPPVLCHTSILDFALDYLMKTKIFHEIDLINSTLDFTSAKAKTEKKKQERKIGIFRSPQQGPK